MVALSVHVVMLQVLNVPYPSGYPTSGWPVFCNLALTAFALTYFYLLSMDDFALPARCLLLFVLAAMLREALIRLPVMNGFATTAWRYSFVDGLPRLCENPLQIHLSRKNYALAYDVTVNGAVSLLRERRDWPGRGTRSPKRS